MFYIFCFLTMLFVWYVIQDMYLKKKKSVILVPPSFAPWIEVLHMLHVLSREICWSCFQLSQLGGVCILSIFQMTYLNHKLESPKTGLFLTRWDTWLKRVCFCAPTFRHANYSKLQMRSVKKNAALAISSLGLQ